MKHLILLLALWLPDSISKPQLPAYNDGPYVRTMSEEVEVLYVENGALINEMHPKNAKISLDKSAIPVNIKYPKENFEHAETTQSTDSEIIAVSDIHGQFGVFKDLLQGQDVIDEDLHWAFGDGHLVIVGDVMDRGDQVMECLWLIYRLEQEAEKAGGKVHFLLGNHELMIMHGDLSYLHKKYRYTSALVKKPYNHLFNQESFMGKWLTSKNVVLKLNNHLFVHGGISKPAMNLGLGLDGINHLFRDQIYFEYPRDIMKDPTLATLYLNDGPLWYRGYAYPYSFKKKGIDSMTRRYKVDNIIVGHTTLPEIKGLYENKIVLIDSSIKFGEQGQALVIKDNELFVGEMNGSRTPLISEEQKDDEEQPLFSWLMDQPDVAIELSITEKELKENFNDDNAKTPGTMTVITAPNEQLVFNATFKPGGKSRRAICKHPPIKINLKKKELANFNYTPEYDRLKIVMQCQDAKTMSESIRLEKLVYDLHNVITPFSHKAHLIRAKTVDQKRYLDGILLETREDLSLRNEIKEVETKSIATEILDRREYLKMCLFQYMIANTDWSARKMHNSKFYQALDKSFYTTIPYDFDYAGLINNNYAQTPEQLPITDVTQRYFMDKLVSLEELKQGVSDMLALESDILSVVQNADYISDGSKKRVTKFLEGFFKTIKDDKKVARMLKK